MKNKILLMLLCVFGVVVFANAYDGGKAIDSIMTLRPLSHPKLKNKENPYNCYTLKIRHSTKHTTKTLKKTHTAEISSVSELKNISDTYLEYILNFDKHSSGTISIKIGVDEGNFCEFFVEQENNQLSLVKTHCEGIYNHDYLKVLYKLQQTDRKDYEIIMFA